MASAAESIEKGVDSEISNLNERIANLNERIRVIEQSMSAMREFIKEALGQSNWFGENFGGLVPANAPGSFGVESDNFNMESKPKEMGGTGKEEGGFKILKEPEFNPRMMMGLCVRDHKKTEEIKKEEVEQEENVRAHQFKFLGKIESRDVIVFVGLSATNNFISKQLVNALGIPLRRTQRRFRVNFGCGPGSEGAGVCEGVVLKTQGIEIVETFFVTDFSIADVVLGNQWLRTLGDTTLQGMPMSLTFKWQGRTVKLEADPSLSRRNEIGIMMLDWI
ncbi:hypothetical protein QN277_018650 [Acacia crassicarpa]|uniref:Uncharacterized protein n=1 Tax=Acacia crassicarpa TaxID=499986 RepID=A0AAE1KJR7_9FABA|nr:hypothetical protein QN277_018650 [Acacia crassicarpa]